MVRNKYIHIPFLFHVLLPGL